MYLNTTRVANIRRGQKIHNIYTVRRRHIQCQCGEDMHLWSSWDDLYLCAKCPMAWRPMLKWHPGERELCMVFPNGSLLPAKEVDDRI